MSDNHYKEGDYLVICDRTGFKKYASECVETWDGKFVWKQVYEGRHPQDFVRARGGDEQQVPISRPRPDDVEITYTFILLEETLEDEGSVEYFLLSESSGRLSTEDSGNDTITADDL